MYYSLLGIRLCDDVTYITMTIKSIYFNTVGKLNAITILFCIGRIVYLDSILYATYIHNDYS